MVVLVRDSYRFLFAIFIFFNSAVFLIEQFGGRLIASQAIVADSYHTLLHIIVALLAFWGRSAPPILSKISVGFLFLLSGFMVFEALESFFNPSEIRFFWMLILAIFGFLANLSETLILKTKGHSHESHGAEVYYSCRIGDLAGSGAAIIAAMTINLRPGWNIVDPLAAMAIAFWLMRRGCSIWRKI